MIDGAHSSAEPDGKGRGECKGSIEDNKCWAATRRGILVFDFGDWVGGSAVYSVLATRERGRDSDDGYCRCFCIRKLLGVEDIW